MQEMSLVRNGDQKCPQNYNMHNSSTDGDVARAMQCRVLLTRGRRTETTLIRAH